jgi:hypothetical protein
VATVTSSSVASMSLPSGTSQTTFVGFHTGAPGTGKVILTATTDLGAASFGELAVTVTN